MTWLEQAACRDEDPEDWDPLTNGEEQSQVRPARARHALDICHRCPVRIECLTDAIEAEDWYTIRGGLTGNERRILAGKRNQFPEPESHRQARVTARRQQVRRQLERGLSTVEAAAALGIDRKTVSNDRQALIADGWSDQTRLLRSVPGGGAG